MGSLSGKPRLSVRKHWLCWYAKRCLLTYSTQQTIQSSTTRTICLESFCKVYEAPTRAISYLWSNWKTHYVINNYYRQLSMFTHPSLFNLFQLAHLCTVWMSLHQVLSFIIPKSYSSRKAMLEWWVIITTALLAVSFRINWYFSEGLRCNMLFLYMTPLSVKIL